MMWNLRVEVHSGTRLVRIPLGVDVGLGRNVPNLVVVFSSVRKDASGGTCSERGRSKGGGRGRKGNESSSEFL